MKTKARLYLSLGALSLLVFVLAIVSITSIWNLRGEGQELLKANYRSVEYMQGMLSALDEMAERDSAERSMREMLLAQQGNVTERGEAAATRDLGAAVTEWLDRGGDPASTGRLRERIHAIIELNSSAISRRAAAAEKRGETALAWVTLTGTFCALIALSLLFSIPEHFMEPIRKLTEGIDRVAEGNYRERVVLDRTDEFGHMADRFNTMATELERWKNSKLARIMEEKTRAEAVINSLQDASVGLDEQGIVLFANEQALELLNMTESDIVGRSGEQVARNNDLLRVMLSGERHGPLKVVKDGREQFFVSEQVPIFKSGERLGAIVVLRNVTPFEEKDRAKSHFLATISHELKTPLASTDIGLTLLERQLNKGEDNTIAPIVSDLRKDHQRLVRIVSELLDIAQVETGNIRMNIEACALDILIDDALAAVKVAAQQKDILFPRRTGYEGCMVLADADKAVWVLVNVLGNAIRHSPQSGLITLETAAVGAVVDLSIIDQGPGVAAASQDRLFQRFAPGPGADHGTGLGLSISREFMLAMGGGISYRPEKDQGAAFVLTFATP